MSKNIVLCCDGTNNEFGLENTNVVKLYRVLVSDPERQQVLYYHPGLGTMGAPSALTPVAKVVTRIMGLLFGYGLSQHLIDLYGRVMAAYEVGDRICLFGFSRGAYTARAVASMLHMFGLLRAGNDVLIPYAIRLLKQRDKERFEIAARFKNTFSIPVTIHFVGVWDTVSSVGTLHDPLSVPFTARNPAIQVGRHAVALDERRAFYRQNLWDPLPGQDIKQVWFPGVHCDVGGGYPERESGLSKLGLMWMAEEARAAGILLNDDRLAQQLGVGNTTFAKPDPCAKMHDSLTGVWWLAELVPRRYYVLGDAARRGYRWKIPMGRRRFVPSGSLVHASVLAHIKCAGSDYHPKNLPRDYTAVETETVEATETAERLS